MATLLQLYHARRADSTLRQRVESAVLLAARDIRNESDQTANHAERLAWANAVRAQTAALATAVDHATLACVENATIGANPDGATDNDIQFVVGSVVNQMAGVEGA